MPYIEQVDRVDYIEEVETLKELLTNYGETDPKPGEVNYVISKLIWDIFDRNPSYTLGNNLVGVLECVKDRNFTDASLDPMRMRK